MDLKQGAQNEYNRALKAYVGAKTQAEQMAALNALIQAKNTMTKAQEMGSPAGMTQRSDELGQGGSATHFPASYMASQPGRFGGERLAALLRGDTDWYPSRAEQGEENRTGIITNAQDSMADRAYNRQSLYAGLQERHPQYFIPSAPAPAEPPTNYSDWRTNINQPATGGYYDSFASEMDRNARHADTMSRWNALGNDVGNAQPVEIRGYSTYESNPMQASGPGAIDITNYGAQWPQGW